MTCSDAGTAAMQPGGRESSLTAPGQIYNQALHQVCINALVHGQGASKRERDAGRLAAAESGQQQDSSSREARRGPNDPYVCDAAFCSD